MTLADQCVKRACFFEHRKARGDRTNASVPAGTLVPAGGRRKFDSLLCPCLLQRAGLCRAKPGLRSLEQLRNRQFGDCIGQSVEVLRTAPDAQDDLNNYGPELINVTQRAALQAVAPHLQNLESQNVALRQRLAVEARHRLDQRVERAVPDYREIDRDPQWHRWLLGVDTLTGRVRQQLLNDAIAR